MMKSMNLHFDQLHRLQEHIQFLQQTTGLDDFFIVWGAIRDLILGHTKEIVDVDLTMAGEPDDIWKKLWIMNSELENRGCSIFRTEKFGTMTIVRKWKEEEGELIPVEIDRDVKTELGDSSSSNNLSSSGLEWQPQEIKYEITPFREESGYSDFRHPEKIVWSGSLIADAWRRDFSINAMYYSWILNFYPGRAELGIINSKSKEGISNDNLLRALKDNWFAVVDEVIILQNHELIDSLLQSGKFNKKAFIAFCKDRNIEEKIVWIVRDPYLGIQDIINGKIKCVGDADKRFNEDALRILRAIRFQNVLNFDSVLDVEFDFEKDTWKNMKKFYYLVKQLSKERIHEEIKKVFSGPNPFGYVAVLDELNLLKYVFPNIINIKKLEQPVRYHPFDVYSHTLLALHHLQSINTNYLVRLAMLYHDVGKAEQYYTHSFGLENDDRAYIYWGWLNHINCGQDMVKEDLEKIWFGSKEIAEVMRYVWWHMKPGEILMSKKENRKKKLRELYADGGYERVINLLDICRWDRRWHFNPIQKPALDQVHELYVLLEELQNNEGQFSMSKMAIDGNDLMKEFDIQPGKKVGELMKKAYEWVLEDLPNRNDKNLILIWLKKTL